MRYSSGWRCTALLLLLAACGTATNIPPQQSPAGDNGVQLPAGAATISGQIARLQDGSMLVEEHPGQPNTGRKIVFRLERSTIVAERVGNTIVARTQAELQLGQRVEAWANGPLAESYPEQGSAAAVLIALPAAETSPAGVSPAAGSDVQFIKAELPRAVPAGGSATAALVAGNTRFAFDLYNQLARAGDDNLIFSPYSIALAFSMAYAGARGQTAVELAAVLGLLPPEQQHAAFNALVQHISGLEQAADIRPGQGEPFRLRVANAAWGQQDYPFEPAFLATLAQDYGAGIGTVDFENDPAGAAQLINRWIADATENKIPRMLAPEQITPATRLILANAVYFSAGWQLPFFPEETAQAPFRLLDGSTTAVQMMRQQKVPVNYQETDAYQAALVPYAGRTTDILLVLPKPGQWERVSQRLDPALLSAIRSEAHAAEIVLAMPRWEFETTIDLVAALGALGLQAPFDRGSADFSGIARGRALNIDSALHKATISVDETGTEATAATVVALAESALLDPPVLTLDRPFVFAIVERDTGTLLFLGRVTNPASF